MEIFLNIVALQRSFSFTKVFTVFFLAFSWKRFFWQL